MRLSPLLLAATSVALAVAPMAHADTFNFSFGTPGMTTISGSGVLTGSASTNGSYLITSVTGTTDAGDGVTQMITALEQPGAYDSNDNLVISDGAGGYAFDYNGLSYLLNGGAQVNLFTNATEETLLPGAGNENGYAEPITLTANTPEPGSFVLLGTGLLGAVGVARRRLFA